MESKNTGAGCLSALILFAIIGAIVYFFIPHYDCIKMTADGSVHCSCEFSTNDEWNKFKDNTSGQHHDGWDAVVFPNGVNPCDTLKKVQENLKKAFPNLYDKNKTDNNDDHIGEAMDTTEKAKSDLNNRLIEKSGQVKNLPNSQLWQNGEKVFCEGQGLWKIAVTIKGDSIFLASYPTEKNTNYKDKFHPTTIDTGIIRNNDIYVTIEGQQSKTIYRYVESVLYQANTEDGYNYYSECR